jgi:acetoacetyl-CoA synthetase
MKAHEVTRMLDNPSIGFANVAAREASGCILADRLGGDLREDELEEMEPIFSPSDEAVAKAQLTDFASFCRRSTQRDVSTAEAMHAFSVSDARAFWSLFLEWSELATEGSAEPVRVGDEVETAQFFPELRLNYVENLLRGRPGVGDDHPAITACNERGEVLRWTRGELRERVLAVAHKLRGLGLTKGDRVVAIASNTAETIVACLATLALGATWSSIAPDVGAPAVLARFAPLAPKVIFVHTSYLDRGERHAIGDRIEAIVRDLATIEVVIALRDEPMPEGVTAARAHAQLSDLMVPEQAPAFGLSDLERFPFRQPLFILFSSGTTGRPKCLVHSAGGTLLEHHKEHRLHADFGPTDKLYFHTTCSWMMWNWLVSALACGTEIVVYEGAITYPEADSLWTLVSREHVTVFGTSPAFLQYSRDAGIAPKTTHDLDALRAIQSTGSVLKDALFEWIHDAVKAVPIQSISGGTDIIGCFFLGHPWLPVYAGELQAPSLGMDVRALGEGEKGDGNWGELVCANPFPSRPIGIYGDDSGQRFHDTYFSQNPGYWTHGDLLETTPRGSARIHGRSDGILNVGGVRIGPAEIYAALDDIDELAATMAIEQRSAADPGGSRLVLLLVLRPGLTLTKDLQIRIRRSLSQKCSRAHVPSVIAQLDELPETHNGKRAERAARDAANGNPVANVDALRNPGVLDVIRTHPALAAPPNAQAILQSDGEQGRNGESVVHDSVLMRVGAVVGKGIEALLNRVAGDTPREGPAPERTSTTYAPPRDAIERELCAMWGQVLGVQDVGVDDDFFELGGQSLSAVLLFNAMQRKFDIELPLSMFLHASTVAQCAKLLREALEAPPSSRAAGAASEKGRRASSIPPSREGAPAKRAKPFRALVPITGGKGVPFFCVHGAGGNILNFRDLSRALPADQAFYGLQAYGVDGVTPPKESIEAMAEAYLTEVREAQPHGPYLLGGYSGGGVVAFEMALRLTAAGEEVALLAFFDTFHPQMQQRKNTFARRVARLREERFEYVRGVARRRAAHVRQLRDRRAVAECQRLGVPVPLELRELHLTASFLEAQARYLPGVWPGRATLFHAETVDYFFRDSDTRYGWDQHVEGGVDVVVVPGDHHTLVLGANAQILAKALDVAIQRSLGRTAAAHAVSVHARG